MTAARVSTYVLPPVNQRELLRYAGAGPAGEELGPLIEQCVAEWDQPASFGVCWREFPLAHRDGKIDLGFTRLASASLEENLRGCGQVVLFAATVGLGLDRLIQKYSLLSPAKALIFQALGAERVESLAETFCADLGREVACRGLTLRPRFSPGYGDFPLSAQEDIFRALEPGRWLGLTLNRSLLMSPAKSVTGLIGLSPLAAGEGTSCSRCLNKECAYRRED